MPELSIEYFWLCLSAREWQRIVQSKDGKNAYIVRWDNYSHKNRNVQFDYSCTCKGYKMRGRCRHIEEAKAFHCRWHQFEHGGEPPVVDGKHTCPRCGGPVTSERWGV